MALKKRHLLGRQLMQPGLSPGTLVAPEGAIQSTMYVFAYNSTDMIEMPMQTPGDIVPLLQKWDVVWVNITGLGNIGYIFVRVKVDVHAS